MADFEQLRQQLAKRAAERSDVRQQFLAAREQLKKSEARLKDLQRRFHPNDEAALREREALEARQERARSQVERLRGVLSDVDGGLDGLWKEFLPFTDPRETIRRLNDRIPFVLFPVRLETRFQRTENPDGGSNHLCVRIYPDECSIDTFEPLLSEVEAINTRRFWAAWWSAGGSEAGQRSAWRLLVGSHGSGRAGYLVDQYRPTNAAPTKVNAHDVILVIVDAVGLPPAEQTATAAYWRAIWLADGDASQTEQAGQALVAAVGADRAAILRRDFRPQNLAERPPKPHDKANVDLQVVFARFPTEDEFPTQRTSWTQAARARLLPERFVLLAYRDQQLTHQVLGNPISPEVFVGPDPQDAAQFTKQDGDLAWGDAIRWMADFNEAIAKGFGFRLPLTQDEARRGFDRILVLGIRAAASPVEAAKELEDLLHNHLRSRSGFALLPQGTATNNGDSTDSYFQRTDDPDDSFDVFLRDARQFEVESDDRRKRDGQWLAQWLGIRPRAFERTPNAGQPDQSEARAMNVALWPATLGYFLESQLQPVLDDQDVEFVRTFFTRYVSGRGPVPALRIGRQPYGILPATPFSRLEWPGRTGGIPGEGPAARMIGPRLQRLYSVVRQMEADWRTLLPRVSFVGKTGENLDAHQVLLDILGLHPNSIEFHYRYAHSLEYLLNHFRLLGFGSEFEAGIAAWFHRQGGLQLLAQFGYTGSETPEILDKFFFSKQSLLNRFLIDDVPSSETAPVRSYTTDPANPNDSAGRNYLRWLREAAATSLDAVRRQQGFWNDQAPQVLLYVLLRHALLTGYHETGLRVLRDRGILDAVAGRQHKTEARFINIAETPAGPESRWRLLYEPAAFDAPNVTLAQHIATHLGAIPATNHLQEQLTALERLETLPTARLERLLIEHLDCCAYRLDAWRLGVVHLQLDLMRATPAPNGGSNGNDNGNGGSNGDNGNGGDDEDDSSPPPAGVHLGAYGWLNNVRPENKPLTPVQLTEEQSAFFLRTDKTPPMRDGRNDGHILAPSLNQAVTAAILRNGYRSNVVEGAPEVLAVDLSSERVRLAVGILEGMRNGQKLGALLGYRFERALHDRTDGLELDRFILPFRQAFPLTARRLKSTEAPEGTPVENLEARNVLDGLAFVKHLRAGAPQTYPYGKGAQLPADASAAESAALNVEVVRLLSLQDAIADLAIAESVHQVVLGNYERTAANLDAYAGAASPAEPEVVRTPRSGKTLTHRIGLHLDPNAAAAPGAPPRSTAEPALQQWLSTILPDPGDIACLVEYRLRNDAGTTIETVTAADLQLTALDLIYQHAGDGKQATSLDDRVITRIAQVHDLHPGSVISIRYTEPVPGKRSFWQVTPLLESLATLLLGGRPLEAADIQPPAQTTTEFNSEPSLDAARIQAVLTRLDQFLTTQVQPLEADLASRFDPPPVQEAHLAQNIEVYLDQFATLTNPAGDFGLVHSGFSNAWGNRQRIFGALIETVSAYIAKWEGKLQEFEDLIAAYPATPPADKVQLLLRAERLVSTISTDPAAIPDPDPFLGTLQTVTRPAFTTRLAQLTNLVPVNGHSLSQFIAAAEALDNSALDAESLDFGDTREQIVRLAEDLSRSVRALRDAIQKRLAAANDHWAAHLAAGDAATRVKALLQAGQALLGEDFRMFPSFSLRPDHANEWANAWNDRDALLGHAATTTPFPVDDWLYGVARVRERLRHYETVVMLSGAFETFTPELTPLQFPFTPPPDYHWLGLAYPEGAVPATDVLLYTAHYPTPFNAAALQCGVLLDEWTEVIPEPKETTGLAFHYDRPNCEAPQAWLLATPAAFTGSWRWEDLVDSLHDTLEVARLRAIEPAFLDPTVYAPFLPATVSAAASREISIVANYALAANLTQFIPKS